MAHLFRHPNPPERCMGLLDVSVGGGVIGTSGSDSFKTDAGCRKKRWKAWTIQRVEGTRGRVDGSNGAGNHVATLNRCKDVPDTENRTT